MKSPPAPAGSGAPKSSAEASFLFAKLTFWAIGALGPFSGCPPLAPEAMKWRKLPYK